MKIKIILKTGKEIELTKDEFEELKLNFTKIIHYTVPVEKTFPQEQWYEIPDITCDIGLS